MNAMCHDGCAIPVVSPVATSTDGDSVNGISRTWEMSDDASLLRRLQSGDSSSYEALVRAHGGRMLAVAKRLLQHEDDARDAVQEAFLSAFKSIRQFQGHARLATWLHRIVVNASLMKLRSRKQRQECSIESMLPAFDDGGHRRNPRPCWQASAHTVLEQSEMREVVREKIELLPEDYRTVLILRDIEELDTVETAGFLGITPGSVKTRLHRARMALRELLETEFLQCTD
jgi:RNA polymerase sigma-70 factor, ECF subfamily